MYSFFLAIGLIFSSYIVFAENIENTESNQGLIELHTFQPYDKPYRDRRPNWSWNLAFQYEGLKPDSFVSTINDEKYSQNYRDLLTNTQIAFGPKYNTKVGSFGVDLLYSAAHTRDNYSGDYMTLSFTKTGAAISYTMDTLFPNPYVAPYIQGQIFKLDYKENDSVDTVTGTTTWSTAFQGGVLIQLNWMDDSSARRGYIEDGLLNSYLDLYVVQYNTSTSKDDPDFQTAMNFGVGFRVEF